MISRLLRTVCVFSQCYEVIVYENLVGQRLSPVSSCFLSGVFPAMTVLLHVCER